MTFQYEIKSITNGLCVVDIEVNIKIFFFLNATAAYKQK